MAQPLEGCRVLELTMWGAAPYGVSHLADMGAEVIITVDHPTHGPIKEVGITVDMTLTPGRVRSAAPELGQHTEEVLTELGGMDWEELARLKESGVIT